jgi:sarcosine oxidase
VVEVAKLPTGEVLLHTNQDDRVVAATVVLTVGPWLPAFASTVAELSGGVARLPPLTIRRNHVLHFPIRSGLPDLPSVVHRAQHHLHATPSGAGTPIPAMQIAHSDLGVATTAQMPATAMTDTQRNTLIDYVREWMPALDPEPVTETSCLTTMTMSRDFILDHVGPLVVASPCSGHGAKFAPLVGSMIADLVTGQAEPVPRFRLDHNGSLFGVSD